MYRYRDKESKILKQFSRFAHLYDSYNIIQAEVAKTLIQQIPKKEYACIVDIGCGSGEIYKNLKQTKVDFKKFIALDSSKEMLDIHPIEQKVYKYYLDFNTIESYKKLNKIQENILLLSSSALQWGEDLDFIFRELSKNSNTIYFAIFTSNTFKTLHKSANIDSPIYSEKVLKEIISRYYDADFEVREYRLEFETVREMFKYIKKSGVSGGEKQLTYTQIKKLMDSYPLNYLEFEVLFVSATSLADASKL